MKKRDSFSGQKMVILPTDALNHLKTNELTCNLYLTDIGFFPTAEHHFRKRCEGIDENILIFCSEGKGYINMNENNTTIISGDFIFIPKNTPHHYYADSNAPWSIYWVHFSGRLESIFIPPVITKPFNVLHESRNRTNITTLFNDLIHLLEQPLTNNNLEYSHIQLYQMLGFLKHIAFYPKIADQSMHSTVQKAISFMQNNFHRKPTIAMIATATEISVSHLCLLFRKHTGKSPNQHLTYIQISAACNYLTDANLKIKEIARLTGFEDPYYFSRVFSKTMGQSPKAFREKNPV